MKNKSENHVRRQEEEEEEDQSKISKMIAYLKVKVKKL